METIIDIMSNTIKTTSINATIHSSSEHFVLKTKDDIYSPSGKIPLIFHKYSTGKLNDAVLPSELLKLPFFKHAVFSLKFLDTFSLKQALVDFRQLLAYGSHQIINWDMASEFFEKYKIFLADANAFLPVFEKSQKLLEVYHLMIEFLSFWDNILLAIYNNGDLKHKDIHGNSLKLKQTVYYPTFSVISSCMEEPKHMQLARLHFGVKFYVVEVQAAAFNYENDKIELQGKVFNNDSHLLVSDFMQKGYLTYARRVFAYSNRYEYTSICAQCRNFFAKKEDAEEYIKTYLAPSILQKISQIRKDFNANIDHVLESGYKTYRSFED